MSAIRTLPDTGAVDQAGGPRVALPVKPQASRPQVPSSAYGDMNHSRKSAADVAGLRDSTQVQKTVQVQCGVWFAAVVVGENQSS